MRNRTENRQYVVDAKSILGIFRLDLSKLVTIKVYCDECNKLLGKLAKL